MNVKPPIIRNCAHCGAEFRRPPSRVRAKFCGLACLLAYRATRLRGRPVPHFLDPLVREKRLRRLRAPERVERMRELMTGRPRASELTRRGSVRHYKALHFSVKSPAGMTYQVDNLSEFVRSHPHLFDPADVINRSRMRASYQCRATQGLRKLRAVAGTRLSWKGWTLTFGCQDELGRQAVSEEAIRVYENN